MRKGEKTKRKLFEAAAQLFGRYDFYDVSVDAIVEAAGVAKGTFYIYFESKDKLIAAFLSDYVSSIDAGYKAHYDSLPPEMASGDMLLSLIAKITDVLVGTIGYHRMKLVYKVQLTEALNMDPVKGYNRKLYQMFTDVLTRGIKRGEFHTKLSVKTMTKHFVMAIRGLSYEWCIRYPDFDLKEEALLHFRILLNGVREVS
ncbi:MAG: TetR/AcrR family transcriptional regulator [Clostridiales bacterium]|jgi:AcrR family transcriptional regulator|nr:TetR/AcrR family transcriptional regulator [Clostridiales bacterium]